MTSKIWPPPNEVEQAQIDDTDDSLVTCDNCEEPAADCTCDYCGDCDCSPCECGRCSTCGYMDCECPDCYVTYYTTVTVHVDTDGDVVKVTVQAALDDPDDVIDVSGASVKGEVRERALQAVANQDWPGWDIE